MQTGNTNINLNQRIQRGILQSVNANASTSSTQRLICSAISKSQTDLSALTKGEILKGEIINLRGTDIHILLNDGQTIQASFESTFPLYIGDHVSFFVEESSKNSLHLRLLPPDGTVTTDATIDKALEEAFLPKNEKNISIVQELLKNGLSIDKKSIMNMLRQSATFRNISIETLAIMNKYQIPLTQENTTQLEAYRNYEFRLLEQTNQLTTSITSVLEKLPEDSPILENFFSIFPNSSDMIEETKLFPDNLDSFPMDFSTKTDQEIDPIRTNANYEQEVLLRAESQKINDAGTYTQQKLSDIDPIQNKEDTSLKQPTSPNASDTTPTLKEIPSLESLLQSILKSEFTIPFHKLTQPNSISKFYEKLEQDLDRIHSFFEQHKELTSRDEKETIFSQTNSVKDNINFMKTINQLFGYVQLPMKLPDKEVHSELFVYTNKKKLREGNQQVSVLLHLDMTHLGPIDFHLSLLQKHISAKISMKDEKNLAFVEQHLPDLLHVLEAKGYQMTYQMEKLEKESKLIRDAFETDTNDLLMRRYSFDLRA